jgi:ribosomal protein S18 acetylase RimI-like enzyme
MFSRSGAAHTLLSPSEKILFTSADMAYVDQMVQLHERTNPTSFLTSLGSDFLRAMYARFIRDSDGIAVIAVDPETDRLAGTAIGCTRVKWFYRKLGLFLCFSYAKSRLNSLYRRQHLNVGAAKRYQGQVVLFPDPNAAYFTQLNVSPDFQRRGVGTDLAAHFYSEVRFRGLDRVFLITDADNASVRSLHEKMGCTLVKEFTTPANISRCLYTQSISSL